MNLKINELRTIKTVTLIFPRSLYLMPIQASVAKTVKKLKIGPEYVEFYLFHL